MLWNTQIIDTCIIFPQWHIHSNASFLFSILVIVCLCVLYEYLRVLQQALDFKIAASLAGARGKGRKPSGSGRSTPEHETEESGLLTRKKKEATHAPIPCTSRIVRAAVYGASVFLSFFLMLIFMTYNAYLIAAVVVGAAFGHFIFNGLMDVNAVLTGAGAAGKAMTCH